MHRKEQAQLRIRETVLGSLKNIILVTSLPCLFIFFLEIFPFTAADIAVQEENKILCPNFLLM